MVSFLVLPSFSCVLQSLTAHGNVSWHLGVKEYLKITPHTRDIMEEIRPDRRQL